MCLSLSRIFEAYDFVSFPASIYSSYFLKQILGPNATLTQTLGWSVLINTFYLPGTFAGAFVCDKFGPKNTMLTGLVCQAIFGFALAGAFGDLKNNIAGLVILYGFFVAFGEFGSGNNLGLLASKAVAPSAVRGTFYGTAAGIGKGQYLSVPENFLNLPTDHPSSLQLALLSGLTLTPTSRMIWTPPD